MRAPLCLALILSLASPLLAAIDRQALVSRHNPHITRIDPEAAVTVGNGDFAFTADVTGLQSFPDLYFAEGIPLETLSTWAWHSDPNPEGLTLADTMVDYPFYGREVAFPAQQSTPAGDYFRRNPHPVPLGRLGLELDGQPLRPEAIADIDQTLDLWTGVVVSRFTLNGEPVEVVTAAAGEGAGLAVIVGSPLIEAGRLRAVLAFPFDYDLAAKNKPALIWDDDAHQTVLEPVEIVELPAESAEPGPNEVVAEQRIYTLERTSLDARYYTTVFMHGGKLEALGPHRFALTGEKVLALAIEYSPELPENRRNFFQIGFSSLLGWNTYWTQGGMVQLNQSKDPRALELERRIILSQYLLRVNYAGNFPPAEAGLTQITWYGKHNSEMYFWHAAHWYTWGRTHLLERGLAWYRQILPAGMAVAREQGFEGVRWPKMAGIDGRPGPGTINPFIIWNQPNPIYLAELVYRDTPTPETLETYRELVFASADFLASYAQRDAVTGRYHLGPPIKAVTESTHENETRNPTFELAYWHFALQTAQQWRARLGLEPEPRWQAVIDGLSPLPVKDGKYLEIETFDGIYASGKSVPYSMLMALGYVPATDKVDPATMRATFEAVTASYPEGIAGWNSWSVGAAALTCARLGLTEEAVTILSQETPKYRFMPTGHVRRPKEPQGVPTFLPVNAALLNAIGLMAAGWEGAPDRPAPGFPDNGQWVVEVEGMQKMP